MDTSVFSLDPEIYAALGGGYLAYATACAGRRGGHKASDAAFYTLAFGLVALAVYRLVAGQWAPVAAPAKAVAPLVFGGLAGVFAAVFAAALWRGQGWRRWLWLMRRLRVHGQDESASAWASFYTREEAPVSAITVHRATGDSLHCGDVRGAWDWPFGPYILGADGSVALYVTHTIGDAGPTETAELVQGGWPTLTFVPAREVRAVDVLFAISSPAASSASEGAAAASSSADRS